MQARLALRHPRPAQDCRRQTRRSFVSGNIEDYSDDSGSFSLDQVPAGRQGTPRQGAIEATRPRPPVRVGFSSA